MNHDVLLLPRHCVTTDKEEKVIIVGAGPILQVFSFEASKPEYPLSTIHCFDRQNVNVEFIQPIADTGHYVIAGGKFLTVLHKKDIKSDVSWMNGDRICQLNADSTIKKIFSVVDSACFDSLMFSLFVLHTNNRLIRYGIDVTARNGCGPLSIKSSVIEEEEFEASSTASLVSLTPTSFVAFQQIERDSKASFVVATSVDGRFLVRVAQSGYGEVAVVDMKSSRSVVMDESGMSDLVHFILPKKRPTVIGAVMRKTRDATQTSNLDDLTVVTGYIDGTLAVTTFDGLNGQEKTVEMNPVSDPITSIYVDDSQIIIVTQYGNLKRIPHPLNPLNANMFGTGSIVNSSRMDMKVYSCSFHLFRIATTAILVMGQDITLFLVRSKEFIEFGRWDRQGFHSASLTVCHQDLYQSEHPRLLILLFDSDKVSMDVVLTSQKGGDTPGYGPMPLVTDKVTSITVPPLWVCWNEKQIDFRLTVLSTLPNGLHVLTDMSLDILPSGRADCISVHKMLLGDEMESPFSSYYQPSHSHKEVMSLSGGKLRIAEYGMGTNQTSESNPSGSVVSIVEFKSPVTVAAQFTEETINNALRRTVLGTVSGEVIVYCLDGNMMELSIGRSEIVAISAYHCHNVLNFTFFNLFFVASKDGTITMCLYRDGKLSVLSDQKCRVEDVKGVYCTEEVERKSLRVVVVGRHIQVVYFCLSSLRAIINQSIPLNPLLPNRRSILISSNPITFESKIYAKYVIPGLVDSVASVFSMLNIIPRP